MEPDDPLSLHGQGLPGDAVLMVDSIVEEYARIGWTAEMIEDLFNKPFFRATHGLTRIFGEAAIRDRIRTTLERCGVFRVRVTHSSGQAKDGQAVLPTAVSCLTPDGASVTRCPLGSQNPSSKGDRDDAEGV